MNETLTARRQQVEDTFNELQKQKTEKETEVTTINEELLRLQGEYRTINSLLEEEEKPKTKKKASKEAEVIDVTGVKGA